MYHLVQFKRNKKISAVPSIWIFKNEKGRLFCWWPLYGLIFKLKNMVPHPHRIDVDECKKWTEMECEYVVKEKNYRTYEEADNAISLLFGSNEIESEASLLPLGESTRVHENENVNGSNHDETEGEAGLAGSTIGRVEMGIIASHKDTVCNHGREMVMLTVQTAEMAVNTSQEEVSDGNSKMPEMETLEVCVTTNHKEIVDDHTQMLTVQTAEVSVNTSHKEIMDEYTETSKVQTVEIGVNTSHKEVINGCSEITATCMHNETDHSDEGACGGGGGGGICCGDENLDALLLVDDEDPYNRLEDFIQTEANFKALLKKYGNIFATNLEDFIERMMERTFKPSFFPKIGFRNWPNKVNVSKTKLLECWIEAVQQKTNLGYESAKTAIKEYCTKARNAKSQGKCRAAKKGKN